MHSSSTSIVAIAASPLSKYVYNPGIGIERHEKSLIQILYTTSRIPEQDIDLINGMLNRHFKEQ